MQGDATDQLDIIMHHVPRQFVVAHHDLATAEPAGAALHRGKCLWQQLVKGLARLAPVAKLGGLRLQLLVAERLVGTLDLVDTGDDRPASVEELAIMATGEFLKEPGNHEKSVQLSRRREAWQMANPLPSEPGRISRLTVAQVAWASCPCQHRRHQHRHGPQRE